MNLGQADLPCRGSCGLIPGGGCFDDLDGHKSVVSPPSPIVEPLISNKENESNDKSGVAAGSNGW